MNKTATLSLIYLLGIAFVGTAQAQSTNLNGGFETGTFTADTTWAGGQAVTLATPGSNTAPEFPALAVDPWLGGWATNTLKGAYWVDSSSAYDGSKYIYLSGQDICLNLIYGNSFGFSQYYQGLTPGQTYQMSFLAASAQDLTGPVIPTSQTFRVEWSDAGANTVTTTFNLAPNAAWSDTAQTVIPWELHSYFFTPTTSYGVMTLSTDATASTAWVLDGVQIAAAPEPSGALLLCIAGGLLIFRKRRFRTN
jgi:hypothetical protein